jgi:hypothetical protein
MKYFIKRDVTEYGPYSLADLQKYLQSGQIAAADQCRSEGMSDWVPVSQVVGNISMPAPMAAAGSAYGGAAPAAAFAQTAIPPNMHWGLVLLLSICTCGLFGSIWLIVQSAFVKKVDADSKGMVYLLISLGGLWVVPVVVSAGGMEGNAGAAGISGLGQLAGLIFHLVAIFQMKHSLESYYLNQFGYSRGMSGVMTFFFAPYYFQYHINDTEKLRAQVAGGVR